MTQTVTRSTKTGPKTTAIPTPAEHLGFEPGTARKLAPWSQIAAYFQLLGQRSPRVSTEILGNSTEGRPFLLSIIASEETHARLDHYREMQSRLADPRDVSGTEIARC